MNTITKLSEYIARTASEKEIHIDIQKLHLVLFYVIHDENKLSQNNPQNYHLKEFARNLYDEPFFLGKTYPWVESVNNTFKNDLPIQKIIFTTSSQLYGYSQIEENWFSDLDDIINKYLKQSKKDLFDSYKQNSFYQSHIDELKNNNLNVPTMIHIPLKFIK